MSRVRLDEASLSLGRRYGNGIPGVIFRKGQFNPAVSSRSPFSRDLLCPQAPARWQLAAEAAQQALRGQGNPFIQTPWEKAHGLSLVVNFYFRSPARRAEIYRPGKECANSSSSLPRLSAACVLPQNVSVSTGYAGRRPISADKPARPANRK